MYKTEVSIIKEQDYCMYEEFIIFITNIMRLYSKTHYTTEKKREI